MAYELMPGHFGYPAAAHQVVESRKPPAFAEPVPEIGALPGFECWAREPPYLLLPVRENIEHLTVSRNTEVSYSTMTSIAKSYGSTASVRGFGSRL